MKPKQPPVDPIAKAIYHVFESPNECDSNGEIANVVDGLYAIARSIRYLANKLERDTITSTSSRVTVGPGEPGYEDGIPF